MTQLEEAESPPRRRLRDRRPSIEEFVPLYLRRYLYPYHGDFCFCKLYHPRLMAQLMSEGFLPIATPEVLLPKLHEERCVVDLSSPKGGLHVSRSTRKKSKKFQLTVNQAFEKVVEGCQKQHGDRCWLYPPLVQVFREMHQQGSNLAAVFDQGIQLPEQVAPVRVYSIEVWNLETGDLAAGELGYTVGSIYTSLTGFAAESSAGSVQLAALGRMLQSLGFSLWDLGMEMEYKRSLGCHLMPREDFVSHVHAVRASKGDLVLPDHTKGYKAKEIIDQSLPDLWATPESALVSPPSSQESACAPPEAKRRKSGIPPHDLGGTGDPQG